MTIQDLILSIIASATASGLLAGILIWLSREWISTRLKTTIQHEYDQKLEIHKANLKAQSDLALLKLKTGLEKEATLHAAAHASFAEGQKAAIERKLIAVDELWSQILNLRNNLPPIIGFIDVMTVDEYKSAKDHKTFQALTDELSLEKIISLVNEKIERVRPYVGEYLWAVFFSYQAIMLRILYLMHLGREDAEKIEWHKDSGTRQLMKAVLTADEITEFDKMKFSKVSWLQRRLEVKVLTAIQKIISREKFGAESLEQAKNIQQRAANLYVDIKTT